MDITITSEFIMIATAIVAHYFTSKDDKASKLDMEINEPPKNLIQDLSK